MGNTQSVSFQTPRDATDSSRRILREIWANPGTSRISISQSLGLNKSTVTKVVGDLLTEGMVREGSVGEAGPAGGRRPVGLTINPEFGCFAGISVRATSCVAGILDFSGEVLWKHTHHLDFRGSSLVPNLRSAIADLRENAPSDMLGVGIGVAGIVDPEGGVLRGSIPMAVADPEPLVEQLGAAPFIRIENDANALCWGELMHPDRPDQQDFISVLGEARPETPECPVSVGLGLAVGGRVHHGADFSSGEFRSPLWSGAPGQQFGIPEDELRYALDNPATLDALVQEMAVGLAVLVNALNLSTIYLEGFFVRDFERHAQAIGDALSRFWPYPGSPNCSVKRASRGDNALWCGAAALIQHDYYGR